MLYIEKSPPLCRVFIASLRGSPFAASSIVERLFDVAFSQRPKGMDARRRKGRGRYHSKNIQ